MTSSRSYSDGTANGDEIEARRTGGSRRIRLVILYNHPDGEGSLAARIVTIWRRR
jgi:hypothetical protein